MKIRTVTLTGADDRTTPEDRKRMSALEQEFPFVEWGILLSAGRMGTPRYPSMPWLDSIEKYDIRWSGHLCGALARDFLTGRFPEWLARDSRDFDRLQINFTGKEATDIDAMGLLLRQIGDDRQRLGGRRVIFQIKPSTRHILQLLTRHFYPIDGLVDASGGQGLYPGQWPSYDSIYPDLLVGQVGYAGGLHPHCLAEQLQELEKAVGDHTINIDVDGQHVTTRGGGMDPDYSVAAVKIESDGGDW